MQGSKKGLRSFFVLVSFLLVLIISLPLGLNTITRNNKSTLTYRRVNAVIYEDDQYKKVKKEDPASIELSGNMPQGSSAKAYPVTVDSDEGKPVLSYD